MDQVGKGEYIQTEHLSRLLKGTVVDLRLLFKVRWERGRNGEPGGQLYPRSEWSIRPLLQAVLPGPQDLPAHHPKQEDPHQLEAHLQAQVPVPQDVIVIVTTAQPVVTGIFPPDTGAVDDNAEQGWGW